ncbi:MAG: PAS domain-containing sensor histidine kinase [Chloroflexi bacterium]|nr:PAS domain-containing sensor histidine kinase [Chloroflexota bacterium]
MTGAEGDGRATFTVHARPTIEDWLARWKNRLYPYRPRFQDRRFWAVQGLVLLIAGTHLAAELLKLLGHAPYLGSEPRVALASFVTVSLFYVPVVYAALNFGFAGSIATALWCTVLTMPNVVVFHGGMERVREFFQIGIVDAIAFFVGQRVDRESRARHLAEAAGTALRASETKYRSLFESTPLAILLLDGSGRVVEANPAAGVLFGKELPSLKGLPAVDLLAAEDLEEFVSPSRNHRRRAAYRLVRPADASEVYVEPTTTVVNDSQGQPAIQLLLRDVTEEHQRQTGLRTYAAHVLRAQEEERKRIAQELHDEIVQKLVLLCRRLDAVESAGASAPAGMIGELREARRSAEEVAQGLRDFAGTLRPSILEDLGLVPSVRRLLLDLEERTGAKGRLKVEGEERRLPGDVELGLFRIAQEALRNVERHARARRVAVAMSFEADAARLEVVDNGLGFLLPAGTRDFAASGKLGLLGMQERAELLGGSLEIESGPRRGTRVSVSIPLPEQGGLAAQDPVRTSQSQKRTPTRGHGP